MNEAEAKPPYRVAQLRVWSELATVLNENAAEGYHLVSDFVKDEIITLLFRFNAPPPKAAQVVLDMLERAMPELPKLAADYLAGKRIDASVIAKLFNIEPPPLAIVRPIDAPAVDAEPPSDLPEPSNAPVPDCGREISPDVMCSQPSGHEGACA